MTTIRSVLTIDDNPGDVYLIEYTLRETGRFQTLHSVTSAAAGLQLLAEPEHGKQAMGDGYPPHLLLLDINMPSMDGFEFLEAYRAQRLGEDGRQVIVVMVSSSSDPRDREKAESLGASPHFVTKPLTEEDANKLADLYGS